MLLSSNHIFLLSITSRLRCLSFEYPKAIGGFERSAGFRNLIVSSGGFDNLDATRSQPSSFPKYVKKCLNSLQM